MSRTIGRLTQQAQYFLTVNVREVKIEQNQIWAVLARQIERQPPAWRE
jgi:hypothetical protein